MTAEKTVFENWSQREGRTDPRHPEAAAAARKSAASLLRSCFPGLRLTWVGQSHSWCCMVAPLMVTSTVAERNATTGRVRFVYTPHVRGRALPVRCDSARAAAEVAEARFFSRRYCHFSGTSGAGGRA